MLQTGRFRKTEKEEGTPSVSLLLRLVLLTVYPSPLCLTCCVPVNLSSTPATSLRSRGGMHARRVGGEAPEALLLGFTQLAVASQQPLSEATNQTRLLGRSRHLLPNC